MRRSPRLGLVVVGALIGASWSAQTFAARPTIEIFGNIAITADLYRTLLDVSRCGESDTKPARYAVSVQGCIEHFLQHSGYELASVRAIANEEGNIEVLIDEGRLDRIVIVGVGPFTTFRLRFALDLPGNVFNRPLLERRLAEIRENYDIQETSYQLYRVANLEPDVVQVPDPKVLDGLSILSPQQPYELRVYCEKRGWTSGLRLSFGFDPPDGVFIRGGTRVRDVIFTDDSLRIDSKIGVRVTDAFGSGATRLGLSRANLVLNQSTPRFIADLVSAFLEVNVGLIGRARRDLQVDSYLYAALASTLNLQLTFSDRFSIWAGAGIEQRFLFNVQAIDGMMLNVAVDQTERQDRRALAEVGGRFLIGSDELRLDRDHAVSLTARHYFPGTDRKSSLNVVHASYQNVFALGWDEFWLGLRAAYVGGDIPFYNEISIGEGFLRAGFSGQFFARKLASLNVEYRFSVSRDVLKVSVFNDVAVFRELSPDREELKPLLADTVGLGLHVLVFDAFQVNAYSGVAFASNAEVDIGFALRIVKAF